YLAELSDQLRASVSTFRLPDRGNEMMGAFPGMASVTELAAGNGSQFYQQGLNPGAGTDWNQGFSGNFPPLPEPGNSGSLVALPARNGQYAFNSQQDYAQPAFNSQGFNGQQGFDNQQGYDGQQFFDPQQQGFNSQQGYDGQQFFDPQQGFNGQQGFDNQQGYDGQQFFDPQQGFNNQQSFGTQPGFGGQSPSFAGQPPTFNNQQNFGGQQNFGSSPSFGNQPGFGDFAGFEAQQNFSDQGQFGNQPGQAGFAQQGQPLFPPANQMPNSPQPNAGQGQQPQGPASRQHWQRGSQQGQNQNSSQFGQDQAPFPHNGNGQFGQ
nr:hypothetical protein [Ktedonobacteraceae bacterium]